MTAWLSRLMFDADDRDVPRLFADAARQHRFLMRLAPQDLGEQPRKAAGLLYRIDRVQPVPTILVQTSRKPDVDAIVSSGLTSAAVKDMTPLLSSFEAGQLLRYRIVANPTKRWGNSAPAKAQIGKLHVLHGGAAEQWWTDRAEANGLKVQTVDWRPLPDAPAKGRGRHAMAQFDGTAHVTDPAALSEAVLSGIGRSRSYGCGLLSLAPYAGRS